MEDEAVHSGAVFAALVETRLGSGTPPVRATVRPLGHYPGSFFVDVEWGDSPEESLLFMMNDREEGVTVLDPGDEWFRSGDAIRYIASRLAGSTARDALKVVRRPRHRA